MQDIEPFPPLGYLEDVDRETDGASTPSSTKTGRTISGAVVQVVSSSPSVSPVQA